MAGSQGVISAAWQGQLGPPRPVPCVSGCCCVFGSIAGEGSLWYLCSCPLLEPGREKGGESCWCLRGRHPVPIPFPQKLKASVPPPHALCSLPFPSVFIDLSSWRFSIRLLLDLLLPVPRDGGKSQDMWVLLWRKDQTRYSAAAWGKSEGGEEESWFCRVP